MEGTVINDDAFVFWIKAIDDPAVGMLDEEGRQNGSPMARERHGANRPNP